MANALFLLENRVDNASLSASTTAAAFPVGNIQSEARADVWRSGGGVSSYVDITFASAGTVNAAAFVDLNLTTAGTIRIEAWTDAIGGASKVLDRTDKPNIYGYTQTSYAYGAGAYGVGPYGLGSPVSDQSGRNVTILVLAAPVSARFWRVTFSDGNTAYQQVSRIYLTTPKSYAFNVAYGWEAMRQPRSPKKESLGGQIFRQKRDSRLVLTCAYDNLTDIERADALLMSQTYGEDKPFVFSIFPEASQQGLTTSVYGTFSGGKVVGEYFNSSKFPFNVVEEF